MWNWDQGHLEYFQFNAIRRIAAFSLSNDLRAVHRDSISAQVGLPFAAPETHSPWRQYSRAFKLALLVFEDDGRAVPTAVSRILASPGLVTADEYFHFLARTFTDPAPALQKWNRDSHFRYPLLIALKYLLAKVSLSQPGASFDELLGLYAETSLTGDEAEEPFINAILNSETFESSASRCNETLRRQARESLLVLGQISYLGVSGSHFAASLNRDDAEDIFKSLTAIEGVRAHDREAEIARLANLFVDGSTDIDLSYPHTSISDVEDSGFSEGGKVRRTHIVIERNAGLRRAYFQLHPSAVCDACVLDTARMYPWTERILDLHHLLPLASGTRVSLNGTVFEDLVPVCPTCHRAVHRYYDQWLDERNRKDFESVAEAKSVYSEVKLSLPRSSRVE